MEYAFIFQKDTKELLSGAHKTLYLELESLGLYLAQNIISSHFTASFCLFSLESRFYQLSKKMMEMSQRCG